MFRLCALTAPKILQAEHASENRMVIDFLLPQSYLNPLIQYTYPTKKPPSKKAAFSYSNSATSYPAAKTQLFCRDIIHCSFA